MRKLVAVTQMTLDGVMQALGGPEEDPSGGFDLGGWSVGYFDDALGQRSQAGRRPVRYYRTTTKSTRRDPRP
jgi:hypothetical protein